MEAPSYFEDSIPGSLVQGRLCQAGIFGSTLISHSSHLLTSLGRGALKSIFAFSNDYQAK